MATRQWIERVGIALDRAGNVLILDGSPDQTISQNAALSRPKRWACVMCRVLDVVIEGKHCDKTLDANHPESNQAMVRVGVIAVAIVGLLFAAVRYL